MRTFKSLGYAFLAYVITSFVVFGHPFGPAAYLAFWLVPLGAPLWPLAALLGAVLSAAVFFPLKGDRDEPPYWLAAFLASSQVLAVLFVGIYAETLRSLEIVAFAADDFIEHSFFLSHPDRGGDLQFSLHAAALKDCVPYAWSYREMAFYRLEPGTAVNVLPVEWLKQCSITRPD